MKKMMQILFISLVTLVLTVPSTSAIYVEGEDGEPIENEYQITKMIAEPEVEAINAEDTEIYETTVLESEPTENAEKVPVLYIVGGLVIIGRLTICFF